MSFAARSTNTADRALDAPVGANEVLTGPVAVCVDRPLLSLDRQFTYELSDDLAAGIGSLVQVPFHGKLIRGWVLGPTTDVPERMLPVRKVVSPVRYFDASQLELCRWVSERYVAPLASVIARSHPPRVASEEVAVGGGGVVAAGSGAPRRSALTSVLETGPSGFAPRPTAFRDDPATGPLGNGSYTNGDRLLGALRDGSGTYVVRTAPGEDARLAVECVARTLDGGRSAIVIVPEVDPVPAAVAALVKAFGDGVARFFGGDKRSRYRMWLDIAAGRYAVVVGTRAAVFAPLRDLGLLFVGREHHALHREERSPYFHVRDVATARSRIAGEVCVLSSVMPSLEASALEHVAVEPVGRTWPPVEVVKPGPEGRAPRLVKAIRAARRAFLYEPLRGYGVARVCRACGEPAACASCGGALRSQQRVVRCVVCGSPGRCASCGASDFGLARGGAERVGQWARSIASVPVTHLAPADHPRPPGEAEIVVGGIDAVKDFGEVSLDLVAILNADASLRRPGVAARERALATWAEVAAWASPDGRVILQTNAPNDPAVQALVVGKPDRFARTEAPRLAQAGFPVGGPVFRIVGSQALESELTALPHRTLLVSNVEDQTICLVALDPANLATFGGKMRRLAERGVVIRVEAEPHL
jgi:primosomal protein N' (replication factor Y) (superfamily II helicase)